MSVETIGLLSSLVGIYDKVVQLASEKHKQKEAREIAARVRYEVASLVYEHFGKDSKAVAESIISNPIVSNAIIAGEPVDRLQTVFKQAYQELSTQVTGGLVLDERVERFADQMAGVLLKYDLNPSRALGNKIDAFRQETADGLAKHQDGISQLRQEVMAATDPFRGQRAQIEMTQAVLKQGKVTAAKVNAHFLFTQADYNDLPQNLQHHVRTLLSSATMYAGEFEAALKSFEATLKAAPDNLSLTQNTATVNLLAGCLDRAEELSEKLLKIDPRDAGAMGVLIQTVYRKHGMDGVQQLKKANPWITTNPRSTGALTMVYLNEGLDLDAEELLRPHIPVAIESFHDVQLVTQLATALCSRALEELKRVLPPPGQLTYTAAKMLEEAEATYSQAIAWLETTDHNDVLVTTLSNRSTVRMLRSDDGNAIKDLEAGLKIDPAHELLRLHLSRFQVTRGQPAPVIERIKQIPSDERLDGENGILGTAYLIVGDPKEAVQPLEAELTRVIDAAQRVALYVPLLTAYAASGDEAGIKRIQDVIEHEANEEPTALAALANVLWHRESNEDADKYFRRAVESTNERGKDIARTSYADFLMSCGKWDLVVEQLSKVIVNSDDEIVHRNLAAAFFNQGDYINAYSVANSYMEKHSCTSDIEMIKDRASSLLDLLRK